MKQLLRTLFVGSLNSSNHQFAGRLASLAGLELVAWFTSGEQSINEYSKFLPDVIFVDVLTDDLSGVETSRWLRDQDRKLRIVLVSVAPVMEFLDVSMNMNLNGYLPKEITYEDLHRSVNLLRVTGGAYNHLLSTVVFSSWLLKITPSLHCATENAWLEKAQPERSKFVRM